MSAEHEIPMWWPELRHMIRTNGPMSAPDLHRLSGYDVQEIAEGLAHYEARGLLTQRDGVYSIPSDETEGRKASPTWTTPDKDSFYARKGRVSAEQEVPMWWALLTNMLHTNGPMSAARLVELSGYDAGNVDAALRHYVSVGLVQESDGVYHVSGKTAPNWAAVNKEQFYARAGERPALLAPVLDRVPVALRARNNWVGWRLELDKKQEKLTKVPKALNHITTHGYGAGKSSDRRTWVGWDKVLQEYGTPRSDALGGIGFMFGPGKDTDGFVGIDLDKCRNPDTGELSPQAREIVAALPGYWEVSPSKTGIKGFFTGTLPNTDGKGCKRPLADAPEQEVEAYDRGRFFCVTGHRVDGATEDVTTLPPAFTELFAKWFAAEKPKKPQRAKQKTVQTGARVAGGATFEQRWEKMLASESGAKIRALLDGDTSAYGGDDSRADAALLAYLAFWFGKNAADMEAAFSRSKLAARDKWRERPDYRSCSIANAIDITDETYDPRARPTFGPAQPSQAARPHTPTPEPREPRPDAPVGDATGAHAGGTPDPAPKFPKPEEGEAWNDPFRLARLFVDRRRAADGGLTLVQWRDEFHSWNSVWQRVPDGDLDAALAAHCREVFVSDLPLRKEAEAELAAEQEREPKPVLLFPVTARVKTDARVNLAGQVNHPDRGQDAPFWLWGCEPHPAAEVIAAPNGLFTLRGIATAAGPFEPPGPRFFTPNALPFAVPEGEQYPPRLWMECLRQWFNGDATAILALQEWAGLLLSANTSAHKILLLVGPPRSGKGTVIHILTQLIGAANVASTTFAALGENFGLEPLVGKRVAVIPDARLSGRTDVANVVERLLSISGEDAQTVNRKNRPRITTRLNVRFLLATNEIPRLQDASGALASRFEILSFPNSFLGKEDRGLKDKLAAELPAILAWAAKGYVRLCTQGMRFTATNAASEYQRELEELSSPVKAFVRERCSIGPASDVLVNDLFGSWKDWNEQRNREPGTQPVFGRDLHAAYPSVRTTQVRRNGAPVRLYRGIGLRPRDDWGDEPLSRDVTRDKPTSAWADENHVGDEAA